MSKLGRFYPYVSSSVGPPRLGSTVVVVMESTTSEVVAVRLVKMSARGREVLTRRVIFVFSMSS